MTQTIELNLSITPDELNRFCEKLLNRSRDISKTHDALSTLEAFVTTFSRTANHADAYQTIEHILKSYTEKTRAYLLDEKTSVLIIAMKELDRTGLANIHYHLSRNGFYQILEAAITQLSDRQITAVRNWCNDWVKQAQNLAEQASGYPDAYDFKKAGIEIKEFQAMKDISHFMNNTD